MSGCSELEILEIEAKYGKLPSSYRQIISLIGHSAGFLGGDTYFYVSTDNDIDQVLYANEDFLEFKKETIEKNEVDDELFTIPENIFIIDSWNGNDRFILTSNEEYKEDSPVYVYQDIGTVEKECLSVWEWIDGIVKTSFDGERDRVSDFWAGYYRKPQYTESGKEIIKRGY
ncbi:MAG: SMI1/KNR4 family protein [Cyanobacteria bacterium P01_A01_bin.84]